MSPMIGWGLALGTLAILGMPPFGVFASEFLILTTAMRDQPWATPFLLVALGVAFAAVFSRVQPMVFGETTVKRLPHRPAMIPVFVHLALVLMLGLWIPPFARRLVPRGRAADRMRRAMNLSPLGLTTARVAVDSAGSARECHRRGTARGLRRRGRRGCAARGACGPPTTAIAQRGFCLHVAADRCGRPHAARAHRLPGGNATYPDLAAHLSGREPHAARRVRSHRRRLRRRRPAAVAVARELADRSVPVATRLRRASDKWQPGQEEYAFVRVEGDGVHEIPVGPVHAGIIEPGHFRFQVVGEKVLAPGGAARATCTKASRSASNRCRSPTAYRLAGRVSGDSTVAYAWAYAQAVEAIAGIAVPPRAAWLRALAARTRTHRQSSRRSRLSRQRRRLRIRPRAVLAPQGRRAAH